MSEAMICAYVIVILVSYGVFFKNILMQLLGGMLAFLPAFFSEHYIRY